MKSDSTEGRSKIDLIPESHRPHRLIAGLLAAVCTGAAWMAAVVGVDAAELKPRTVEAFDRYVRMTEALMDTELKGELPFL